MVELNKVLDTVQYSNKNNLNNSTVTVEQPLDLRNFSDVIKNEEYLPYYTKKLEELADQ